MRHEVRLRKSDTVNAQPNNGPTYPYVHLFCAAATNGIATACGFPQPMGSALSMGSPRPMGSIPLGGLPPMNRNRPAVTQGLAAPRAAAAAHAIAATHGN